jgi:hypothetical protein
MSNKPIITKEDWLYKTDQEIIDHVYKTFVVDMAPRSTDGSRCSYLGPDQGCAVGCLWPFDKRQEVEQADIRGSRGDKISAIDALIKDGYVEIPEGVSAELLDRLQDWHDFWMEPSQFSRHDTFLFGPTNPITVSS